MVTFHKTSDTFKTGSMTLPQKYYTSNEVFEREQERIFNKYWTANGSFIPKPRSSPISARRKRSISGTRPICKIGMSVSWASRGWNSKAYTPGWYTPRESLLAAFDEYYLKIMGD